MSYLIAAYAVTFGSLLAYGVLLYAERRRLSRSHTRPAARSNKTRPD